MTPVHRAVILLGLLLAAFGALLGALGSSPVAAAAIVIAGALAVVAGLWLRRRTRAAEAPAVPEAGRPGASLGELGSEPSETLRLWPAETDQSIATAPAASGEAPAMPVLEREPRERLATREADLAREAELDAIAEGLRRLRSRELSATHIPEWKARIETWVDVELKARADRGEEVTPQAAEWMRDFGEIPMRDWRRHLLRHLRRLGYRNYHEGEW
jgi:hypothetical protein